MNPSTPRGPTTAFVSSLGHGCSPSLPHRVLDQPSRALLQQLSQVPCERHLRNFVGSILCDEHIQKRLMVRGASYWPAGLLAKVAWGVAQHEWVHPDELDAVMGAALVFRVPDLIQESVSMLAHPLFLRGAAMTQHVNRCICTALELLERQAPASACQVKEALGVTEIPLWASPVRADGPPSLNAPPLLPQRPSRLHTIVEIVWLQAIASQRATPLARSQPLASTAFKKVP